MSGQRQSTPPSEHAHIGLLPLVLVLSLPDRPVRQLQTLPGQQQGRQAPLLIQFSNGGGKDGFRQLRPVGACLNHALRCPLQFHGKGIGFFLIRVPGGFPHLAEFTRHRVCDVELALPSFGFRSFVDAGHFVGWLGGCCDGLC